jgi:hypothetical protein
MTLDRREWMRVGLRKCAGTKGHVGRRLDNRLINGGRRHSQPISRYAEFSNTAGRAVSRRNAIQSQLQHPEGSWLRNARSCAKLVVSAGQCSNRRVGKLSAAPHHVYVEGLVEPHQQRVHETKRQRGWPVALG